MICSVMVSSFDIRKYSAAEVVLLMIFTMGLLIGYFIVAARNKITLSEQIELDLSGVAVSLPVGPGWESQGWQYDPQENHFKLTGFLRVGGPMGPVLQWRYVLAAERLSADERLAKRAVESEMEIVDRGQIICDGAPMEWAQTQNTMGMKDVFFGVADLGNGRILEIDVIAPGEAEFAELIFQKVAGSLSYSHNELLERGIRFIRSVKEMGVDNLAGTAGGEKKERIYLVDNSNGQTVGFVSEGFEEVDDPQNWSRMKAQGMRFEKGKKGWESKRSVFECGGGLDEFAWRSQWGRGIATIALEKGGQMRVSRMGLGGEKSYWPTKAAIAEVLLDLALAVFVDSYEQEIMVDVIFGNGMIVPTKVSKIEAQKIAGRQGQVWYAVRLDFLYGKEKSMEVYFDKDKEIVGKVEGIQEKVEWHRSSWEELIEKFGDEIELLQRYRKGSYEWKNI